jgi:predicted secreted hydrolase
VRRRRLLLAGAAAWLLPARARGAAAGAVPHDEDGEGYARVVPGYRLRFPDDHASHPAYRIEWWYVTGWLQDTDRRPAGFQVTFFRARPGSVRGNPSAFAPRQIIIAHAAVSDPALGRLLHAQRAARTAFGLAGADERRMRAWIDDWSLERDGAGYRARLAAPDFRLDLALAQTQPPLLQGEAGYSRKGAQAGAASYYYSLPQLAASGTLGRAGRARPVTGRAWLDHEWSSSYMPEGAQGWDWVGVNFDDGGALMAFRMHDGRGGALWAGGSLRRADGGERAFAPGEVRFTPLRDWRSPRTGARYPVAWRIEAGALALEIEPLFDDQEHDARATTGTIYWEGAVSVARDGRPAGRGYLELTGYWRALRL